MTAVAADPRPAQLELLNEIARIATLDLELRPMLQRITDALARKFDWEFVALVTIDRERDAFRCEALTTSVPTSVYVGYGRALGSGVVGEVAASGEPVAIDDVRTYPNYVETLPGARSELCVPVKHRGQLCAVLNLESTRPGAFAGQLPLLTTVADQLAGAIASAQRHAELQERARLMEMMSEVSRTALEATDVHELIERVTDYIRERFPLDRVVIEHGRDPAPPSARPDCELAIPIRLGESTVGTLRLESASPEVFSPANVLAFHAFADQIAGAIRFASLAAQLEQKTRALEDANAHLASAIETLHRISTQDGLTGVSNRRHFDETLGIEWRRAARSRMPLSLLLVDLDFFKRFNDAQGHQAGDDLLRRCASVLREGVHRAADLVARYGGEEFVILLPETGEEHARHIAESLRARIEQSGAVTASIGVATKVPPRDGSGCEELVRRADEALYEAKRRGRNRVV